jgi:iron complex transport system substrate-binding protein
MRVVSLLPSATEIVAALGCGDQLVGISHECDFPVQVTDRPRVTQCEIHGAELPSAQIDAWVRETLAARGTLYTLDEALVRGLEPDVILTQQLCDVCAVNYGSVAAFARSLAKPPLVVNLQPSTLEDILADIGRVGAVLGAAARADSLTFELRSRVQRVAARVGAATPRPTCFLMEWTDPPFCGGHWNPQLVELAGGVDPIGRAGQPSRRVTWEEIAAADPDLIVLALCGNPLERARHEAAALASNPAWSRLRAVREGNVVTLDGNAYFSRPGPRIVDSLELLAAIVHPELFDEALLPLPGPPPRPAAAGEGDVSADRGRG